MPNIYLTQLSTDRRWLVWFLLLGFLLVGPTLAQALTITVTDDGSTIANDGVCSLPEAITAANTNSSSGGQQGECGAGDNGTDTIVFDASVGTVTLDTVVASDTGTPEVTSEIVIEAGERTIKRTGQSCFRLLKIKASGTLTVNEATLDNGCQSSTSGSTKGGSIYNAGTLTLNESTISNSTLTTTFGGNEGGGIYNTGTVSLNDSAIEDSSLTTTFGGNEGGGIYSTGTVSMNESTIKDSSFTNTSGENEGGWEPTVFWLEF